MAPESKTVFLKRISMLLIIITLFSLIFLSPWLQNRNFGVYLLLISILVVFLRLYSKKQCKSIFLKIKDEIDNYLVEILILGIIGFFLTSFVLVPLFTPQLHITQECTVTENGYTLTLENEADIGDDDFTLIIKNVGISPIKKRLKDEYFNIATRQNTTNYFYDNKTFSIENNGSSMGFFLDEGDYFNEENTTILEAFAERYCTMNQEIVDRTFLKVRRG